MKFKVMFCCLVAMGLLLGGCNKKEDVSLSEPVSEEVISELETESIILRETEFETESYNDWDDLFGDVSIEETDTETTEVETETQISEDDQSNEAGVGYMSFGDLSLSGSDSTKVESEHSHDYKLERTDNSKSCTQGTTYYYKCSCGEEKQETDSPAGHQFIDSTVEATCQKEGYTEKKCTVCGYSMKIDKTPKTQHTIVTESVQDPTCLIEGINKTYCKVCGEITQYANVPALGHDWRELSRDVECKPDAKVVLECQRCKITQSTKLSGSHQWGAWQETTKATCSKKGEKTRVCSLCNTSDTQEVEMLAHTEGSWVTEVESTCSKKGYRVKTCSVCKAELKREELPLEAHNTEDWIIDYAATCTSEGKRHKYCSRCNKNVNSEKIPKKEHIGNWRTIVPATCMTEGTREYVCESCGEVVKTGVVTQLPHTLVQTTSKLPTCEDEGYVEFKCSVCGTIEKSVVPATGHDLDSDGICRNCHRKI